MKKFWYAVKFLIGAVAELFEDDLCALALTILVAVPLVALYVVHYFFGTVGLVIALGVCILIASVIIFKKTTTKKAVLAVIAMLVSVVGLLVFSFESVVCVVLGIAFIYYAYKLVRRMIGK